MPPAERQRISFPNVVSVIKSVGPMTKSRIPGDPILKPVCFSPLTPTLSPRGRGRFAAPYLLPSRLREGPGEGGQALEYIVRDAVRDARGRFPDGVPREMRVARRGLHLAVAQQLADHRQGFSQRQRARRIGVA